MKKNLLLLSMFAVILLAWCTTDAEVTKIDTEERVSQEWNPVEEAFNEDVENFQYIKDLEDYISYDVLLNTEEKPFISNLSLKANFDEKSSVQWWLQFSQKKFLKSKDLESMDIDFDLEAKEIQSSPEPFYASWNITLLYQNDEMYAKLHNFWLFMWEWNITAKMYSLLWDMINEKWIDLEVNNWWIISVNKQEDTKLPYIISTLKNVLKTKDIESSPDFLWNTVELINTVNSHIDLWISTDELKLLNYDVSYSETSDEIIQKEFTWEFQWKQSAFSLYFIASKKWIDVHLFNIKEYDEDIQKFKDTESEFVLSVNENKKSEYTVDFQSIKHLQKVVDLRWKIKYSDKVSFSADFVLEPLEIIAWQKITWNLKWNIKKQQPKWDEIFPEISGEITPFSEIAASL